MKNKSLRRKFHKDTKTVTPDAVFRWVSGDVGCVEEKG